MGVLLNDAATEYLQTSNFPLPGSGYPVSISVLYNPDNVAGAQRTLVCLTDISANTEHIELHKIGGDGGANSNKIYTTVTAGGVTKEAFSALIDPDEADVWHQAGLVAANSTSLYAYFDGAKGAIDVTDLLPSGLDTVAIGALRIAATTMYYWSGMIAEVGIWDVALTDIEMAMLAAGYSPLFIRPASLVQYWPLRAAWGTPDSGDYMDLMSGTMFDVNTDGLDDEHPRIIYPSGGIHILEGTVDILGAAVYKRPIFRGVFK